MPKWGGRGDRTRPRRAICADRQFVWGTRYVDDLVLRDRDTSEPKNGVLDERLYALQDPNFNVAALANTGGAIQERYVYEAFGRPKVLDADFSADADGASDFGWEYRYTGRRYDLATGLYDYRSRPYHAELGCFLGRDPIGYGGGDANLYRYVGNGPASAVDPFGLQGSEMSIWTSLQKRSQPTSTPTSGSGASGEYRQVQALLGVPPGWVLCRGGSPWAPRPSSTCRAR